MLLWAPENHRPDMTVYAILVSSIYVHNVNCSYGDRKQPLLTCYLSTSIRVSGPRHVCGIIQNEQTHPRNNIPCPSTSLFRHSQYHSRIPESMVSQDAEGATNTSELAVHPQGLAKHETVSRGKSRKHQPVRVSGENAGNSSIFKPEV